MLRFSDKFKKYPNKVLGRKLKRGCNAEIWRKNVTSIPVVKATFLPFSKRDNILTRQVT